jgi:hypothetical protein
VPFVSGTGLGPHFSSQDHFLRDNERGDRDVIATQRGGGMRRVVIPCIHAGVEPPALYMPRRFSLYKRQEQKRLLLKSRAAPKSLASVVSVPCGGSHARKGPLGSPRCPTAESPRAWHQVMVLLLRGEGLSTGALSRALHGAFWRGLSTAPSSLHRRGLSRAGACGPYRVESPGPQVLRRARRPGSPRCLLRRALHSSTVCHGACSPP